MQVKNKKVEIVFLAATGSVVAGTVLFLAPSFHVATCLMFELAPKFGGYWLGNC